MRQTHSERIPEPFGHFGEEKFQRLSFSEVQPEIERICNHLVSYG